MTDIPTTLVNLAGELAILNAGLAAATAQGSKEAAVAAATRAAVAAITSLSTNTKSASDQIAADGTQVDVAIAARNTALAAVTLARTQGNPPPLADAQAAALKIATATANGVSESDLDSKGVAAVTTLDGDIAALGTAEQTALAAAQTDLAAKQAAEATARDKALQVLAQIQGAAADISGKLSAAIANRRDALQLDAASDKASHRAAAVAYADFASDLAALVNDLTSDPTGTVLKGQWSAAATAWVTALADRAAAEEAVIEKKLALDTKLAERAAKQQTRDPDAVAAVTTAIP